VNWKSNATGQTYTCTVGDYQAMIWYTSKGKWDALVSQNQVAIAHRRCETIEEAKGWCTIHMAEGIMTKQSAGK
jgi:hypothetical protein